MSVQNREMLPDVQHTILINAPIQKVWDAVSTAEGFAAWFMPPSNFEAVLGNEFTLQSQYGVSNCKVQEIDPPNLLVFSWDQTWKVSFELKDLEGKTEFTLTHAGWIAGVMDNGMESAVARERMDHGWREAVLPKLAKYVEA